MEESTANRQVSIVSNSVSSLIMMQVLFYRVREVLKDKLPVIDVDGSYLHRKEQKLNSQGVKTLQLSLPGLPLTGWETFTADNYKEKTIPKVTPGLYMCASNNLMSQIVMLL